MTRIPFGSLPSMSALFLDYVNDWRRVAAFYPHEPTLESVVAFARNHPPVPSSQRDQLASILAEQQKNWGGDVAPVEKLSSGAVAVIAGQQPGLFTGPNYTILKALTALKLARALDAQGVPAVPVFWVAAEDHDYEEIHWASVLDRNSALCKMRVNLGNDGSAPVGWLQFKQDIVETVENWLSALPQSEFQPLVRQMLGAAYRPDVSPADAFARMMGELFRGTGLVLANPLDPKLKRVGTPTLEAAVRKNAGIRSAVLERGRRLIEAGYHEQVKVDRNFTGLFAYRGKSRQALRPDEVQSASDLSPNVLLRPLVQDTIFPTVAYVAGPAEVAYFAQSTAVYEVLGTMPPPLFPRISATIVEKRVDRAMKKYGFEFLDVFRGREFLKRKAVESVQSVDVFEEASAKIRDELEKLRPVLQSLDPTLVGALETSEQKVLHQVETLQAKFINAEAKKDEVLERHLDMLSAALYPEKKLQERVINITSFLVRYGMSFVSVLDRELLLDGRRHQVLEI